MADYPPDEEISPPPFVRGNSASPYSYEDNAAFDANGLLPGRSAWSGLRPQLAAADGQPPAEGAAPHGMPRAGEHSRAKLLAEHANIEEKRRKLEVREEPGAAPSRRCPSPARPASVSDELHPSAACAFFR